MIKHICGEADDFNPSTNEHVHRDFGSVAKNILEPSVHGHVYKLMYLFRSMTKLDIDLPSVLISLNILNATLKFNSNINFQTNERWGYVKTMKDDL